jgi:hypothetical protein
MNYISFIRFNNLKNHDRVKFFQGKQSLYFVVPLQFELVLFSYLVIKGINVTIYFFKCFVLAIDKLFINEITR